MNDNYDAAYSFNLGTSAFNHRQWTVRYIVKGPQKDYVADATYTRGNQTEDEKLAHAVDDYIRNEQQTLERTSSIPRALS